ncbi:MAG: hypothetical protein LBU68_01630, partial [Rickettsiales bacterium]|nr:hypothetical protein [Rickettsiales bacterium]
MKTNKSLMVFLLVMFMLIISVNVFALEIDTENSFTHVDIDGDVRGGILYHNELLRTIIRATDLGVPRLTGSSVMIIRDG